MTHPFPPFLCTADTLSDHHIPQLRRYHRQRRRGKGSAEEARRTDEDESLQHFDTERA